jgi:glyoxylase-like metal-dependent hydrolase (beta-lactamase superfamily II)
MSGQYEVLAIKYAETVRASRDFYIFQDPHDGPLPISYFLWVVRNQERTIVIDTGFEEAAAKARGRNLLRHPVAALEAVGVEASEVETVILTHLHYDHAGTARSFPKAEFIVQDREVDFATGRAMRHPPCRMPFDVENVVDVVRANFQSRVRFVDGDRQVAPGVWVHLIGGHSSGLQAVRVDTAIGPVVLASDAAHFYDNITLKNPFPILASLPDMCAGYERIFELGAPRARVVPGHDPLVEKIFPKYTGDDMAFDLTGELLRDVPW